MKTKYILLTLAFFASLACLQAQDTLPNFSVKNAGKNRIIIGWKNSFQDVRQISIQRSFDSLKNYKSILTVVDPTLPENGYLDTKATNDHMFYRLYILLDKGVYIFSAAKRPVLDTTTIAVEEKSIEPPMVVVAPVPPPDKPAAWAPSKHIYTFTDGFVKISLPADTAKKYNIRFYDDEDKLLFELKEVKQRNFKLDKTNFYHAGWFRFELFENNVLLEKNKFYIAKDF